MKVDPSKYNYVMYVDASGDDGFKFENGSSSCFAAAAMLVKQEDIDHNLAILKKIKYIVGCKETDEVKYSKIRRHRRGNEALSLLKELKAKMSCYIIFKKELPDKEKNSKEKWLSVVCHLMALRSLDHFHFQNDETVLIAIDRMKHTEETPISNEMNSGILSDSKHPDREFHTDVIFRDSKDSNFMLIQIADLLAGSIREHFEQYEKNRDMNYFKSSCPTCQKVHKAKRGNARKLCKNGRSRFQNIIDSSSLKYIFHLIPESSSLSMIDYFFMKPVFMMDQHFYLICKKK